MRKVRTGAGTVDSYRARSSTDPWEPLLATYASQIRAECVDRSSLSWSCRGTAAIQSVRDVTYVTLKAQPKPMPPRKIDLAWVRPRTASTLPSFCNMRRGKYTCWAVGNGHYGSVHVNGSPFPPLHPLFPLPTISIYEQSIKRFGVGTKTRTNAALYQVRNG
jgi:hypothetical protein